jgi:hypothetical protein
MSSNNGNRANSAFQVFSAAEQSDRQLVETVQGPEQSGALDSLEVTVDVIYKPQESEPFRFCDELETGCNPRIED